MSDRPARSQDRDFAATGSDSKPWHGMTMEPSHGQSFAASMEPSEFAGDDSEPEHEPVTWKAASTHLTIASLAFCAAAIIPAIIEPQRALEALLYVSGGLAAKLQSAAKIAARGTPVSAIACSSMATWLAVAMAIAPPEPPSPMMSAMFGVPRAMQASVERAMASAWPRSSAPMPG